MVFVFLFLTYFTLWQPPGPFTSLQTTQFCSVLWLSNIHTYHIFIRSSTDGHLGYLESITNSTDMTLNTLQEIVEDTATEQRIPSCNKQAVRWAVGPQHYMTLHGVQVPLAISQEKKKKKARPSLALSGVPWLPEHLQWWEHIRNA